VEGFIVDTPKLSLLEQFLVDLHQSFGSAPADVKIEVSGVTRAIHSLQKRLKCEPSEKVAENGALKTMDELIPDLDISKVINILKLIYVYEGDLGSAIRFVASFRVEFHQDAYEALYEDVRLKGDTEMPEILLLQRKMRRILDAGSETMKQVDEDCKKIEDRIVEEIRAEECKLSTKLIESTGKSIFLEKMISIVEDVHFAGTVEETLWLIKFSQKLPLIPISCCIICTLFKVLREKNLLQTIHAMHLWAHLRILMEEEYFSNVDQMKCTPTCTELDKNKELYFKIYQEYVEHPFEKKIKDLHESNSDLESILSDFVNFYYNGKLVKACVILNAVDNIGYFSAKFKFLSSLFERMSYFDQLGTFEAFGIFTFVKFYLSSTSTNAFHKQNFEKLKAKAPPCLQLLLWPKPAGAKFRLVNKLFNFPLSFSASKVLCCPTENQNDDQLWSAEVNLSKDLTSFKVQGSSVNFGLLHMKTVSSDKGTEWKIKAVDEHHIKLYFDGKFRIFFFKVG